MFTLVRLALGARVGGLVAEGGGRVVAVGVGDALDARVVLADRGGGVAVGVGRALEAGAGGLVAHGRGGHAVAAGRALRVRGCAWWRRRARRTDLINRRGIIESVTRSQRNPTQMLYARLLFPIHLQSR